MISPASLEGVTLLSPPLPPASPEEDWDILVQYRIIEKAAQLGATILNDTGRTSDFHRAFHQQNPNGFVMRAPKVFFDERLAELRDPNSGVNQPWHKPYADCTADELARFPYMLAVPADSAGNSKYLIERPEQLETFQRIVDRDHARYNLGDWYEIREFVSTPSSRYTSYRVITSPVGEILAAGLLYSQQSKDQPRRIEMELTRPPIDQHTDIWGVSARLALEDPRSIYFLNSLDVCSNVERGGTCIPLIGDNRRPLTSLEQEILAAHDIDPEAPAVPDGISRQAAIVGRHVGKVAGLVIGSDFISDRFLETNTGPGTATWNECWNGGARGASDETAVEQMLTHSLHSIASALNG